MDASYKSSEITVSYNFKTCVPSLPVCFEFSLVMHPSKIHFIETAPWFAGKGMKPFKILFIAFLLQTSYWCVFYSLLLPCDILNGLKTPGSE